MATTEAQKLATRFSEMADGGLVDVKFYLRNREEAGTEQVCREVNKLYEAVDKDEIASLDFKDSRR